MSPHNTRNIGNEMRSFSLSMDSSEMEKRRKIISNRLSSSILDSTKR